VSVFTLNSFDFPTIQTAVCHKSPRYKSHDAKIKLGKKSSSAKDVEDELPTEEEVFKMVEERVKLAEHIEKYKQLLRWERAASYDLTSLSIGILDKKERMLENHKMICDD
jgi:hypothetical protein